MARHRLQQTIQGNCEISDARHNGTYSLCTLVLKLRNLFKWENGLEPWQEPAPPELLDWIDSREKFWQTVSGQAFQDLKIGRQTVDPFDVAAVNESLAGSGLVYGAGYGRSLKEIFFLAEGVAQRTVEGCEVLIMDREVARELAAPFGLLQDGTIYIRRQPMRFYFWDQIQEARPSGKTALRGALSSYGLLTDDNLLDGVLLREKLDIIVDREIDTFIYHEVGERQDNPLDSEMLREIVFSFAGSPVELLARALKDVLADTHPCGLLGYIVGAAKESSLGFYVAFLDGLRKLLLPEIITAHKQFLHDHDWRGIESARRLCREKNSYRATRLKEICLGGENEAPAAVQERVQRELLEPLGRHDGR